MMSVPGVRIPWSTRQAPTPSTARIPMLGRTSMIGSKIGAQAPHLHHAVPQRIGPGPETAHLGIFTTERLDDKGGVEGLVGDLGYFGAQALRRRRYGPHLPLVEEVGDEDRRANQEPDQRQEGIGEDEEDGGDGEHDYHAERHWEWGGDPRGGFHVLVDIGEQLAGGVAAVPLYGELEVAIRDSRCGRGPGAGTERDRRRAGET